MGNVAGPPLVSGSATDFGGRWSETGARPPVDTHPAQAHNLGGWAVRSPLNGEPSRVLLFSVRL